MREFPPLPKEMTLSRSSLLWRQAPDLLFYGPTTKNWKQAALDNCIAPAVSGGDLEEAHVYHVFIIPLPQCSLSCKSEHAMLDSWWHGGPVNQYI